MTDDIHDLITDEAAYEVPKKDRRRPHAKARDRKKSKRNPEHVVETMAAETTAGMNDEVNTDSGADKPIAEEAIQSTEEVIQSTEETFQSTKEEVKPIPKPITLNINNEFNKQFIDTWSGIGLSFLSIFTNKPEVPSKAFLGWNQLMDDTRNSITLDFQVINFLAHIAEEADSKVTRSDRHALSFDIQGENICARMDTLSGNDKILPIYITTQWPEAQAEIARITGTPYDASKPLKVSHFAKIVGALAAYK